MIVLDASAILALIQDEPGADAVQSALPGAHLGTANVAEVVGKLVDGGLDARRLCPLLAAAGVVVEELSEADAELAGVLRSLPAGRQLALGDRCCLALALREPGSTVLTTDRAWAALGLPLEVQLLR